MPYIRKTCDYYVVEQYTGSQYGWEEVCGSFDRKEARANLKEYRENQPEYPARMRKIRQPITPRLIFSQKCSRCGNTLEIFAFEGNNSTRYEITPGAKVTPSHQVIKCKCSSYAEFFLSSYGVEIPTCAKVTEKQEY